MILFIGSLYLYFRYRESENIKADGQGNKPMTKILMIWFSGLSLYICGWCLGVSKLASRVQLSVLLYLSLEELMLHLPMNNGGIYYLDTYQSWMKSMNIGSSLGGTNIIGNGVSYPFSGTVLAIQFGLFVICSGLGFFGKLSEKYWLVKVIVVDWVIMIVGLIVTAGYDVVHKQKYFLLILTYLGGANGLGYGLVKICEKLWNLVPQCGCGKIGSHQHHRRQPIVFDTDNNTTDSQPQQQQPTKDQPQEWVDNVDYDSLTEKELDEILSAPSPEGSFVEPVDRSNFINNLIGPTNLHKLVRPRELIIGMMLWFYSISNRIIIDYSSFSQFHLAALLGLLSTLLAYFTTITPKRHTNKNPSKRES
eukprot:gene4196-5251_t